MSNLERLSRIFRWLILITVLALILYWIAVQSGLRGGTGLPAEVSYRVTGSASVSLVTYTGSDGQATAPEFQPLPWLYGPIKISEPTMVVVTAHNSSQYGSVKCEILLNGKVWKTDQVNNPDLNASCGGYVR